VTALRTTNLTVGYSTKTASTVVLENLNVMASAGEMICLLGPNGSGKSTLLRTLSGVQAPLSGSIEIENLPLKEMSRIDLARRVGVVLTERPLVGALPAFRLVELGRYPHLNWLGQLRAQDHEAVEWAIDAVSARHLAGRESNTLSDGERQRFMIARALAQEPSILVLDEPTAFLDVASRAELMGLLRRLAREEGLAVIVSTHDLELALRVADTIWLIDPGRRLRGGAPEDLILSGAIEEAFPAETIRFDPNERTFRPISPTRGSGVVRGEGLAAALASAVLEREGFEVLEGSSGDVSIEVTPNAHWEGIAEGSCHKGEGFGALAQFVRTLQVQKAPNKIGR
jgi:iron complex transport system ATP-binding protein